MNQFRSLPRNAKACIAVEPLWAFFGPIVIYYAPLFQRALGLDEVSMGVVNSANIAAGFVFYVLATPITNRLGRRATSLVFDVISWSAAMVVWAFARSFAWFLVAGILNAVVRVVVVSWNLLITEDARDDQRPSIHGWMYLIGSASGFITFLGGLLIARYGIVRSMRGIYASGAVVMTIMFVLRYVFTRETGAGEYLREKSKKRGFFADVLAQAGDARRALRTPKFLRLLVLFFVTNAVIYVDFYRILYLQGPKSLSPTVVALMPAVGALMSMILFFFVMPRIAGARNASVLGVSFLLCLAFQVLLIVAPAGSVWFSILTVGCLQTAFFLVQSFRDAAFMNAASEERRGELFSLVQALTFFLSIPLGWLSGLLYKASPSLPFLLSCVLYGAGFIAARGLLREGRDRL